jgi:PAS domain-containing protein
VRFGDFASTLAYVPMPFLLIATLLWGPRGGAVATLLGAVLIVWRTAHGGGPFAITEGFRGEAVVEAQGFVAAWASVLLLMRALSEDRTAALVQARSWRLRYERMLRAIGVASVEYDVVTGRATWGDGAAQALGPIVDSVSSIAEWLDHVDAAERGLAQAAWDAVSRGERSTNEQEYAVKLGSGETYRVKEQLAAVRGADGEVEQVVAMIQRVPAEGSA